MKALRIQVDFTSGRRAGGLDPRRLRGHPSWQSTDLGIEVRAIPEDTAEQYVAIEGVTVLNNRDAIVAVLDEIADHRYRITNNELMLESVRQKGIDLSDIDNRDQADLARILFERGALGIAAPDPPVPPEEVFG